MSISITLPAPPPSTAKVRDNGTGSGSICAKGTASAAGHGARVQASAKIYSVNDAVPNTPPADAITINFTDLNNDWTFDGQNEIPGAQCAAAPGSASNKLAVWVKYADNFMELVTQIFNGVCSTGTDCS
jgi:hypothetical protein